MAQATLDQKEHDMLLVCQGHSLLGVIALFLSEHMLQTKAACELGTRCTPGLCPCMAKPQPSNGTLQLVRAS